MADTYIHQSPKAAKPFIGTRDDARQAGAIRYCDGAPCRRNHSPTIRLTSNMACVACRDMKAADLAASPVIVAGFSSDVFRDGVPAFLGSRSKAKEAGAKYYVNPRRPCEHGHQPSIRLVSNSMCAECNMQHYTENRDEINAGRRADRKANPELFSAIGKARYAANPDYFIAYAKVWATNNPERKSANDSAWRIANAEHLSAYYAAWRIANPDKAAAKAHKRRASKLGSTEHFTAEDVQEIFVLQRGRCAYCRKKLKTVEARDHIVALAAGGSNGRRNLQITCRPCNLSKGAKDPLDFARQKFGLLL